MTEKNVLSYKKERKWATACLRRNL